MTSKQSDIIDLCSPEKKRPAAFLHERDKNNIGGGGRGGGDIVEILSDSDEEDKQKKPAANHRLSLSKRPRTLAPSLSSSSIASDAAVAPPAARRPLGKITNASARSNDTRGSHLTALEVPNVPKNDPNDSKPSPRGPGKTTTTLTANKRSDDVVDVVAAASIPTGFRAVATAPGNNGHSNKSTHDDDDDEIAIVGTIGTNVLTDFPHARDHCVLVPVGRDAKRFCPNCYCYVCDIPSADCQLWSWHCRAHHEDPKWKSERAAVAAAGGPEPYAAARKTAAAVAAVSKAVTTTSAISVPARIIRQETPVTNLPRYAHLPVPREYSIQAILEGVVTVYPREISPPSLFSTELKHYQKQGLAFMQDVERSNDASIAGSRGFFRGAYCYQTRGGWLCAEVGMGKTAIILALVALDASNISPALTSNKNHVEFSTLTRLKATVVVTSVSLLGQWEDECKKHAPGLKCYRFHGTSKSQFGMNIPKKDEYEQGSSIFDADIIVTAATKDGVFHMWSDFCFNRVVIDESHLLEKDGASMRVRAVNGLHAERRWCVTATPFVSRARDIDRQCQFLGFKRSFLVDVVSQALPARGHTGRKAYFYASIELMKKVMIRHTKDQQIGGVRALALPGSTTRLVLLKMSSEEQMKYKSGIHSIRGKVNSLLSKPDGIKACTLEMHIAPNVVLKGAATKVEALVNDFKKVRAKTRNPKVVVFTQYKETHAACVTALRDAGVTTREFSGSTNASNRDKAIKLFQSSDSGAQAFVVTLRAGAVGITLTAASRVYLMEPCLNPATEIQAAGRLHRLGQTKEVTVIKYAFTDSFEENVAKLHEMIARGTASISADFVPAKSVKILLKGLN